MIQVQEPHTRRDNIRLLLRDLAVISGTLSEIATVWRRAAPCLPGLPVILPEQLHDAARHLAADIEASTDAGAGQAPDPALPAADRFSALKEGVISAQAMTRVPGIPELGDRRLWESLSLRLNHAETKLTGLRKAPGA